MTHEVQGKLYNSNQSVVEKLPSFVKLVSPFRGLITSFQEAYKSAYQLRYVVSLTLKQSSVPWLYDCGRNARNVAK